MVGFGGQRGGLRDRVRRGRCGQKKRSARRAAAPVGRRFRREVGVRRRRGAGFREQGSVRRAALGFWFLGFGIQVKERLSLGSLFGGLRV